MQKKIIGLILSLTFITIINAASPTLRNFLQNQASLLQVKERLLPAKSWIPYPDYHNRNEWNNLTKNTATDIIKQGEKQLNYTWQVVPATSYLEYERSGNREIMEQPYNQNVTAVAQLMIAELTEGKGRFMNQIINGVWALCDMQSWALSAHLPVQKSKRSLPDPNEEIIDLVSGDVGSLLSWANHFFKSDWDKINPVISKRAAQNIKNRILDPYMQRSDYWWQALQSNPNQLVNNWNPWCNANVLACYLLMEKNQDSLANAVYKTMRSVDQFINYVKEDGACEEGPSYWGHAAGKLYDYLQLLYYASDGKINLFNNPMIKNMGEYIDRSYVGNGWVVNFADASAKESSDPGLIYRYGVAVSSTEMQAFAKQMLNAGNKKYAIPGARDLFRTLESIKGYDAFLHAKQNSFVVPAYTWYPQTEVCYMKNGNLFFAGKGGFNDESHNHNDVGSFNLYLDNIPFIIDVGVGTYTRQTFSSERYTIWTMQSNYHNVPIINGQPEPFGRQFKAKNVSFSPSKNQFSLDIASAYNAKAGVKKWQRSFTLSPTGLMLEDNYNLASINDTISSNFMTWAKPDISQKGKILLSKENKNLVIEYNAAQLSPAVDIVAVTDKRLSNVWGNTVYRLKFLLKDQKLSGKINLLFKEENKK